MPLPTEQTDFVRSHLLPEDATAQGYWAQRGRAGLTGLARDQGVSHRSRVTVPGTRRFDRQLNTSLRSYAFMQDNADLSPYATALLQREEAKAKASADAAAQEIRRTHVPAAPFAAAPSSIPQLIPPYNTDFILSAPSPRLPIAAAPSSRPSAHDDASFAGPAQSVRRHPGSPSSSGSATASASQQGLSPAPARADRAISSGATLASHRISPPSGLGAQDAGIFAPGDRLAPGMLHDGSVVQLVGSLSSPSGAADSSCDQGGQQLEVVCRLSEPSSIYVYLVKEVEGQPGQESRQLVLRCLSKSDMPEDTIAAQQHRACVHQTLPSHDNAVALYRAYETPNWLFLVLEYCPGQDLFYWLEEAQDELDRGQLDVGTASPASDPSSADLRPSDLPLLAITSGFSILSWGRLNLISSLFQQMCAAVQFCHDHGVAHRDLKPENFIAGSLSGRATVKLTDLSFATKDEHCTDADCGSKPYMSYECCNEAEPCHDPRLSDVWALGVILLNMLFHRNPFQEPSAERCTSFAAFEQDPERFLTLAFDKLSGTVASFLSAHVFNKASSGGRISAAELGTWSADLCQHFGLSGPEQRPIVSRGASMGITSAMSRTHPVHSYSRTLSVPSALALMAERLSVTSPLSLPTSPRIGPDTLPLVGDEAQPRRDISPARPPRSAFLPAEATPSLSTRRGAGSTLTVVPPRPEPSGGLAHLLGSHEEVLDSSDDEVASVASSAKPRRRKRGNRKGSIASRAREAAQPSPGSAASPVRAPNTPSASMGAERSRKAALPAKPMTPCEQPLSWRERNPPVSTPRTSMSSVRTGLSDDTMSIHSTASAPAEVIRCSHESTFKPAGSAMRLQPISEQREKTKPSGSQLDASFLAEMFGGQPKTRTRPDRRRRPDAGCTPSLLSREPERAYHSMDHPRPPTHAPAHPRRQPRGPPTDSAFASFRTPSSSARDSSSLSVSNGSSLSFGAASDRSAGTSSRSTLTPTPSTAADGTSAGKKSSMSGKGFSKLFRK